jgi:beta-glucosidase-like glycosyl hydrolase/CubicO group peptidase (beta-lactamase class C family)
MSPISSLCRAARPGVRAALIAALIAGGCSARAASPPVPSGARPDAESAAWVERTLARLDLPHKVAQLVVPRVSGAFLTVGSPEYERVRQWVRELGVGGLIETLGPPLEAAVKLDMLQQMADVPLLISADMEHGPGQLFNGGVVLPYGLENGGGTRFPPAMGLGATGDERLAYELGRITALEARAVGVHMDFAPVVDVNNNPANPIINTRSFGADPALVARMATAMIRGLEEHGLLATAKHFPGHGDTETDSHVNLPIIRVTPARADSVELPPYRAAIAAGVSGVMTAHIAFPALTGDSLPATLNRQILTGLLRDSLHFRGMVVTDALDMGAIVQGYGATDAPIRALEAGADLLLQVPPGDVSAVIAAITAAVHSGRLTEARIDASVRRLLAAKAALGLNRQSRVDLSRIPQVLAAPDHLALAREATERSLTLVRDRQALLPLRATRVLTVIYRDDLEPLSGRAFNARLAERMTSLETVALGPLAGPDDVSRARERADSADVVIFAPFVRVGAARGTLAIAETVAQWVRELAASRRLIVVSFGSPYVLTQFPEAGTYLLAWGQWNEPQVAAARALLGEIAITGHLPIPIPPLHSLGEGIMVQPGMDRDGAVNPLLRAERPTQPLARPQDVGMDPVLGPRIDSIIAAALDDGVSPGAAVAIGRHGRIVHLRGYGRTDSAPAAPVVTDSTVWDMASLTKVVATTTAIMMLVDDGRLDLDAPVVKYLPEWTGDETKRGVTVRHLLLHDGGLPAYGPLWRDTRGREAYLERIAVAPLEYTPGSKTVYSDYGAILLGLIVERVSGLPLDVFFDQRIAAPLGLAETGFQPRDWHDAAGHDIQDRVAPTEVDTVFRMTHVHGDVHDENAFALGGVAGHAGLFSSARDMATFARMLLGRGALGSTRLVREATLRDFTRRQAASSSRALGWDTPSEASSAGDWFSAASFGHTGFTGTSIWVDPERDVFLVLLTNRVNPTRANQRITKLRRDLADAVQSGIRDLPITRR